MGLSIDDDYRAEIMRRASERNDQGTLAVVGVGNRKVVAHNPAEKMPPEIKKHFDEYELRGVLNKVFDAKQGMKGEDGKVSDAGKRKLQKILQDGRKDIGIDK